MRIALIGPVYPYRGGIAHYTTKLTQTLRERGHDVLLISFKRQYPAWLFPGRSDKDPSSQPLYIDNIEYLIDSLNPLTWLFTFWKIWCYRPQIFVLQWWTPFWSPVWLVMGGLYRLLCKTPLLFICHNVLPHEEGRNSRWLAHLVLRLGTHFITSSQAEQKRLIEIFPAAKVSVVHLPVYDMLAGMRVPKDVALARLNIEPNVLILLFFGIVREYKGLMDLLYIMPKIVKNIPNVRLLIAGEFWEPKTTYLAVIEQLGIINLVKIEDRYIPNEEVPFYFSAADLVVTPYRKGTGSGVQQMAIGFGTPVITTLLTDDSCVVPETPLLIRVPSGDQQALAIGIEKFLLEKVAPAPEQSNLLQETFSWAHLAVVLEGFSLNL